jgi:hypothetical protein
MSNRARRAHTHALRRRLLPSEPTIPLRIHFDGGPQIDTDPARFLRADQPNPPVVIRHQAKQLFGVDDD